MQEMGVQSLSWEDPLEKGTATHSCLENSMDRGAWQATVRGVSRVGHDLVTKRPLILLSLFVSMFNSVQFSRSVVSDSLQLHESQHARPPCPSPIPGVHSHSHPSVGMPSSHLILCRPLLLLPSIPPRIRVFSNESALPMRWPKYCSF